MAMTWSGRRQVLYSGVGAIIALVLLVVVYEIFFTAPPICFDGKQNGGETGVDCGGTCSRICTTVARPPVVQWARAFQTSPQTYSAVAYVQNNNVGAGARKVAYLFQLFDDKNILVVARTGTVDLPPTQTAPIIESNINVGNRVVARTLFAFTDDPPAVWDKIPPGAYPQIRHSSPAPNDDYSKLSTTLTNDTVASIKNVAVVAILYDSNGIALATSKSVVPLLAAKSQERVVFTWLQGVPGAVKSEIIVLPSF
jgi:hypothetical protein